MCSGLFLNPVLQTRLLFSNVLPQCWFQSRVVSSKYSERKCCCVVACKQQARRPHPRALSPQADLINQLYQGKLKDYVRCLECGYESWRIDTYLDIPLVIRPFGASQAYGSVVCISPLCVFASRD